MWREQWPSIIGMQGAQTCGYKLDRFVFLVDPSTCGRSKSSREDCRRRLGEAGTRRPLRRDHPRLQLLGAGIAKAIKQVVPEAYKADRPPRREVVPSSNTFSVAHVERNGSKVTIVNGYTQFHWRGAGVLVDYDAIRSVMRQAKVEFPRHTIAYPKIGAGLAKGDWSIIASIIDDELAGEDHTPVEYEPWSRNLGPPAIIIKKSAHAVSGQCELQAHWVMGCARRSTDRQSLLVIGLQSCRTRSLRGRLPTPPERRSLAKALQEPRPLRSWPRSRHAARAGMRLSVPHSQRQLRHRVCSPFGKAPRKRSVGTGRVRPRAK